MKRQQQVHIEVAKADRLAKRGYINCLDKLIPNEEDRNKADAQVDLFKNKQGLFGHRRAISSSSTRTPADWWAQFGDETPELTSFAIKVLSLTASSSPCERNWSTFSHVHTKKRNRLSTKKLDDMVYVMYNKKLKDRHLKKKALKEDEDPLIIGDAPPSDDEWIANGDEGSQTPQLAIQNVEVLDEEDDDETQPPDESYLELLLQNKPSESSQQKRKGKRPAISSQSNKQKRGYKKRKTILVDEEEEEDFDDTEDEDNHGEFTYKDDSTDGDGEWDPLFKPLDTEELNARFQ